MPRRVIHGVLVNHEFDFFEARTNELEGVVDAYIVQVGEVETSSSVVQGSQRTQCSQFEIQYFS